MAQSLLKHVPFDFGLLKGLPMLNDDTVRVSEIKGRSKVYMMDAKALSIAWGNDPRYWRWVDLENDNKVKVAELIKVNWLEVRGKVPTSVLEPRVRYQVFFVIMMKYHSDTEPEVTLTLEAPNAPKQQRPLRLKDLPTKVWLTEKIGEFETGDAVKYPSEEVKFSLVNVDPPLKRWLMILGVLFLPA